MITTEDLPNSNPQGTDSAMLDNLRRVTFDYFRNEINPRNGLIADKTQPGSPSSIAAVGMGFSVYTWVMHTKSTPRDDSARLVAGRQ
jgi:hypothetical protein